MNILNTRPTHQSTQLTLLLKNSGHIVSHLPLIDIQAVAFSPVKTAVFDHIIFLSANAVTHFFKTKTHLTFKSIIAIGPATKRALENHGISNSICPTDFSSEGLLSLPILQNIKHQHIAIISGENPKPLLQKTLESRGASVHPVFCYRRIPIAHNPSVIVPQLQSAEIDIIISTSSESLAALLALFEDQLYRDWLLKRTLCVISDKMKQEAIAAGFRSIVAADNASDEAIVRRILAFRAKTTLK